MTTKYPPTKIEVFRPSIGEEEIEAVADVMRSGWLGRGPKVEEFESAWARHIGVPKENVVSVGCASEGLQQIMQELYWHYDVVHVVIPDNSFIGTASAAIDNGLDLNLCDIHRNILNPDNDHYAEHLRPRAAIVYQHYGGFGALGYAGALNELCDLWDAPLIEDLACAPMTKPCGDFAVWSFDAMKILTCGDGGMIYCKDDSSAESIRRAVRLGMNNESGQVSPSANWWEFHANTPGRRSMMNDIGAAIGLVQLRKLPQMVARRREIWEYYQSRLGEFDWLTLPPQSPDADRASYYTYWVAMSVDGWRDRLAYYLRERGIYTSYRYWSVSRAYNWDVNTPNSHWASDHVLNLPLHPGLSDDDVSLICETVAEFGRTL